MARIVESTVESRTISRYFSAPKIIILGAVLGLSYWCMAVLLESFTNSSILAGDISTILVATLGIVAMVNLRLARPLVIALAVAVSLWGLAGWTSGLNWVEMVAWDVLLYGLAYTLFSWISRYARVVPVLIVIITIVTIARITTTL